MTLDELEQLMRFIQDCDDYLLGKVHSRTVADIAEAAAKRAVKERKQNLLDRLSEEGLRIEVNV